MRPFDGRISETIHRFAVHRFTDDNQHDVSETNIFILGSKILIAKYEERKPNKMQQSDVYYKLLSQHVSGIIMPIFRRTKALLLHMVHRAAAGCGW